MRPICVTALVLIFLPLLLAGCPKQSTPSTTAAVAGAQPGGSTGAPGLAAGQVATGAPATAGSPAASAKTARTITVWADPALLPALQGLASNYLRASGASYRVVSAERSLRNGWAKDGSLAGQPVPDAILFAGQDDYDLLLQQKRLADETVRTFAGDRLLVVKPQGSTFVSPTLFDLYTLHFKELAIAEPVATALGMFTEQALISDGAEKRLAPRLKPYATTSGPAGVPGQRLDALAILFASQAGSARGVEPLLLVDPSLHEPVQWKAAAVAGKGADEAVMGFLRWLAEDSTTQQALAGYGLLNRATAMALTSPRAAAPLAPAAARPAAPASPPAKPATAKPGARH